MNDIDDSRIRSIVHEVLTAVMSAETLKPTQSNAGTSFLQTPTQTLQEMASENSDSMITLPEDGGCGGEEGSSTGCFDVKEIDEEERTVTLTNCYYAIGGTTYCADDQSVGMPTDGGFIALVVSMSPSDFGTASVTAFANFTALQNESKDSAKYVKPLYRIGDEGAIDLDMRNMPQLAAGEMVT